MPTTVTWIVVTEGDVNDYLVAAQAAALRTAALGAGQGDTFTHAMHNVANKLRTKIQSCARNKVSATAYSIPPSLLEDACYLIIDSLSARLPMLKMTEQQIARVERANSNLNRIADCKDVIEQPDDVADSAVQSSGGVQLAQSTRPQFTRHSLGGL